MKKMFVLLVAVATIFAQDLFAQMRPEMSAEERAAHKAKVEQITQIHLELLKTELALDDEQLAKFAPVYRKYRQEVMRVTSLNREAKTKRENINDDNALKIVSARLANQILTATIKQRYLLVFAEVIKPTQVMKLYRVDERVSREALKLLRSREAGK